MANLPHRGKSRQAGSWKSRIGNGIADKLRLAHDVYDAVTSGDLQLLTTPFPDERSRDIALFDAMTRIETYQFAEINGQNMAIDVRTLERKFIDDGLATSSFKNDAAYRSAVIEEANLKSLDHMLNNPSVYRLGETNFVCPRKTSLREWFIKMPGYFAVDVVFHPDRVDSAEEVERLMVPHVWNILNKRLSGKHWRKDPDKSTFHGCVEKGKAGAYHAHCCAKFSAGLSDYVKSWKADALIRSFCLAMELEHPNMYVRTTHSARTASCFDYVAYVLYITKTAHHVHALDNLVITYV